MAKLRLRKDLSLFFYFAVCWLFTLLVLVHFSSLHWHVFLPLLALALVQALLTGVLIHFGALKLNYGVTISLLVGLTAYFLLGQAFFPACIAAALFGYLTLTGLQRRASAHLWLLMVLSAALGTLYDLYLTVPDPAFILWTLAAELICLCGYLLTVSEVQSRLLPVVAGIFLASAAVLSVVLFFIKPILIRIYDLIFIVFFKNVMYSLASGYWALISRLANRNKSSLIRQSLQGSQTDQNTSRPQPVMNHGFPDIRLIGILIVFAAAILITMLSWKKWHQHKLHLADSDRPQSDVTIIRSSSDTPLEDGKSSRFFGRFLPSRNPVRRTVYMLQKQAKKSGNGRRAGETLTDWLIRLGMPQPVLIEYYQKVRYGHGNLTPEEWIRFHAAAEKEGHQLKELARIHHKDHRSEKEHGSGN